MANFNRNGFGSVGNTSNLQSQLAKQLAEQEAEKRKNMASQAATATAATGGANLGGGAVGTNVSTAVTGGATGGKGSQNPIDKIASDNKKNTASGGGVSITGLGGSGTGPPAGAKKFEADQSPLGQRFGRFRENLQAVAGADALGPAEIQGTDFVTEAEKQKTKEEAMEEAKAEAKKAAEQKAIANKEAGVDMFGNPIGEGPTGGTPTMTDTEAIESAIGKLLREQQDVSREREAMVGEMKAGEARNIQSTRARAGLGGMGLTGAAGAMESQVRQESGREQALTTADFDRKARAEALDRLLKGIDVKRSEEVFAKAMELYGEENKPGEGGAGGGSGSAADTGRGTGSPNVDKNGNPIEPAGGYDASDPPSNTMIPAPSSEAWRNGYNADPNTERYYESLPEAITSGWDKRVDSYVDEDGNLWMVAINDKGQYYRVSWGPAADAAKSDLPQAGQPRKETTAFARAKRSKTAAQENANK